MVAGTSEYQAAWLLDSSEDEDEEDDEEEEEDGGDAAMAGRDGSDEEAPELEDLVDEEDGTGECCSAHVCGGGEDLTNRLNHHLFDSSPSNG